MSPAQPRTPRAEAHAQSRREKILDAAQKCFIEHGFPGASMALIAQTAGISVGLAYRYFDGKNAIMLAIIARELEIKRARIDELCAERDFLGAVIEKFRGWQTGSPDVMNASLFLEMSAEATRSPEILRALRHSDALVREEFERWLKRSRSEGGLGLTPAQARSRGLLMHCLIEGLVIRAARDPDQDPEVLRCALEPLFAQLGFVRSD